MLIHSLELIPFSLIHKHWGGRNELGLGDKVPAAIFIVSPIYIAHSQPPQTLVRETKRNKAITF